MDPARRPIVGIPVKAFSVAKQRLHPILDAAARSVLGREVAARTARLAAAALGDVAIVTGDAAVTRWAADLGFATLAEESPAGLDGAAAGVRDHALGLERPWLVLHADLPIVTAADVAAVLAPLRAGHRVIAPSHDGGTSALGAGNSVEFRYGVGSYQRHLRQTPAAEVIVRPGLAFDLDTVADLLGIMNHARGMWIRELLAAIDSPP